MMKKVSVSLLMFCSLTVMAQENVVFKNDSLHDKLPEHINDIPTMHLDQQPMTDPLRLTGERYLYENNNTRQLITNYTAPTMPSVEPFKLWNGANISIDGATGHMVGLMDMAMGSVSINQNLGRFHLSASALANKYWMPMQSTLYSQFGFGGTLSYSLSNTISLHAFGYYYTNNPLLAPAFSPYVNTTSFGGYADIQISERFGSSVGVRRYINPMTGQWTTAPIVTPYVKIGKTKLGFPVGNLLKALIWGDNDNPTRFRPQPQQPPKDRRK